MWTGQRRRWLAKPGAQTCAGDSHRSENVTSIEQSLCKLVLLRHEAAMILGWKVSTADLELVIPFVIR